MKNIKSLNNLCFWFSLNEIALILFLKYFVYIYIFHPFSHFLREFLSSSNQTSYYATRLNSNPISKAKEKGSPPPDIYRKCAISSKVWASHFPCCDILVIDWGRWFTIAPSSLISSRSLAKLQIHLHRAAFLQWVALYA